MKLFIAISCLASCLFARGAAIDADICVFGGTSAGVIAAVKAAQSGKRVVITEYGRHLGGLTSGGLTYTDIGNKAAIGGLSRDFYRAMGKEYGREEAWTFAPGVAEREFNRLVTEHKIPVYFSQRLASVKKERGRITEIAMEGGNLFRARIFIDASYEGDLMAKAGVRYHVGREANATYGETLNGIRDRTPHHQFLVPVDPYVTPGDPASGLLPFVQDVPFGVPGAGDQSVQAYNFRLCLTRNVANRKPIDRPPNYDERKYELLGRYFDALESAGKKMTLRNFLKIDMVTADKTDINNNGGFSTDFIGANHGYPEADYATRERIWGEHLDYIKGFLSYLATSARVPESIRKDMSEWGLCQDEFQNTGGWPHQMYVREARRMVSDYVMTEKNCRHQDVVTDAVGLAAYNMDSHNCRRVVRNGKVENEGDVQVAPTKPYSISYRSIVPKQSECENLFVPVCLAASHIAYGSIRMEPVFMIMGQAAATAAVLAMEDNVPVQKVSYEKLRSRLLADKQILVWTNAGPMRGGMNPGQAGSPAAAPAKLPGIVVDDADAVKTGDWVESSSVPHRVGFGYIHDNNADKGAMAVVFVPEIPAAGEYEVFLISTPNPNRATNVPVTIDVNGKVTAATVNQKTTAALLLGKFQLPKGKLTKVTVSNRGTDGFVIADGVQCVPVR